MEKQLYARREQMQEVLVVVDMQNDFISGSLGSREAADIVLPVAERVRNFKGRVIFTRDTHDEDYLQSREGRILKIEHCIKNSWGWELVPEISNYAKEIIDKKSFGSAELGIMLRHADEEDHIERVILVGLCTDICVIANAMVLQAFLPETEIIIDASCCAGSSVEKHKKALSAMEQCQIKIQT